MIYFDNAATTMTDPEVVRAMLPFFTDNFGNPSSIYGIGNDAKNAINNAKIQVAGLISAKPSEIYFTSGGTESDNWAITGAAMAMKNKPHIITSQVEHAAVLTACKFLEKIGCEVTYLPVRSDGSIGIETYERAFQANTSLVSIMMANNEVGTIYPIRKMVEIAHERGALFHTDAVQAVGQIVVDVAELGVDLLSASAHKFGGPKGVGFLYVREGLRLRKLITGGSQQNGMRAGTENVPGIVGLGAASEIIRRGIENKGRHIESLRTMLTNELKNRISGTQVNGTTTNRLPNNINVSFRDVDAQSLVIALDKQGVCVSTGAACSAGAAEPSHVLRAMGLGKDRVNSAIRITISDKTTIEEIEKVASIITEQVNKIRNVEY